MKKLYLVICDKDKSYMNALGEYIANYEPLFKIITFSDYGQLNTYLKEKTDLHILLMNEHFMDTFQNTRHISIMLSESVPPEKLEERDSGYKIYKYMPVGKIIEEIKYIYSKASEEALPTCISNNTRLIGFFSPSGGAGTTSIAVAVSRFIGLRDKKTLYFNLEGIPSSEAFFNCGSEKGKNLSDFLYYLFIREESNIASLIRSFIFTDKWNVDCFYPQSNYKDLLQLTNEEIKYLLKLFTEKTDYEYICIDFSSTIHEKEFIFSLCTKNFIIIPDSVSGWLKYKIYNQSVTDNGAVESSTLVINRCEDEEKTGLSIANDPESFNEKSGCLHISLEGEFGKGAKRIADSIVCG